MTTGCPHGQRDETHCQACIAGCWKIFYDAVIAARQHLPEGVLPAMLICINPSTGEVECVAPQWLATTEDQAAFLQLVIGRQRRASKVRHTRLD